MLNTLFRTGASVGPTLLRLALGGILLMHGIGKVVQVSFLPGYGFEGTIGFMNGMLGVPMLLAYAGTLAESVAGAFLVLGLGTRFAGVVAAVQMSAAAFLGGHVAQGFFSNWMGATVDAGGKVMAAHEGYEFHLALVAMALTLVVQGGGWLSLDRVIAKAEVPSDAAVTSIRKAPGRGGLQTALSWTMRHL